ncbi:hypothetical protein M9Y10_029175 [Tritrichomonas musculus]|uniref:ZIP Zinc transporter family protein n=1 Tax=Tritrichomonas musculus TaxID=1915356 RepID=A0ABR2KLD6_9EUKA
MGISLTAIKFICAIVCAILTFFGTVLILCIRAPRLTERAESLAGGVFFGAGFAHLFYDSTNEIFEYGKINYPITGAITIITFIILTTVEIFSYSEKDFQNEGKESSYPLDNLEQISHKNDNSNKKDDESMHPFTDTNGSDSSNGKSDSVKVNIEDQLNDDSSIQNDKLPEMFSKKFHPLSIPVTVLFIIMLIHSFIEGLALGVMSNLSGVIALACAVGGHKPVEAFALGLIVSQDKPVQWLYWVMMVTYVIMSPLGIVVATFISQLGNNLVLGIISAVSSGTFTFIGCDEWSKMYENRATWPLSEKFWHIGLYMVGVLWMLLIAIVDN